MSKRVSRDKVLAWAKGLVVWDGIDHSNAIEDAEQGNKDALAYLRTCYIVATDPDYFASRFDEDGPCAGWGGDVSVSIIG